MNCALGAALYQINPNRFEEPMLAPFSTFVKFLTFGGNPKYPFLQEQIARSFETRHSPYKPHGSPRQGSMRWGGSIQKFVIK